MEGTKVKEDTSRTRVITKTRAITRTSIMNFTTKVNSMAIEGSSIMNKEEAGVTTIDKVKTVTERRMRDQPRGKVGTIKLVAEEVTTNKIKRARLILQEDQPGRKGQSV